MATKLGGGVVTDNTKLNLAYKVIDLEIDRGHLKWKVSELAKLSSVSRALIYYHLGNTKEIILRNAIAEVCEDYYALSGRRAEMIFKGQLIDSVVTTRRILVRQPSLAVFYQKWRFGQSHIAQQLSEVEVRYQKKLWKAWPHASPDKIKIIYSRLHGLVTAPFVTEMDIRLGVKAIESDLRSVM